MTNPYDPPSAPLEVRSTGPIAAPWLVRALAVGLVVREIAVSWLTGMDALDFVRFGFTGVLAFYLAHGARWVRTLFVLLLLVAVLLQTYLALVASDGLPRVFRLGIASTDLTFIALLTLPRPIRQFFASTARMQ